MTIFGDGFLTLSHDTRRYGDESWLGYPSSSAEQIILQRFVVYGFFSVRNVDKRQIFEVGHENLTNYTNIFFLLHFQT